jgi:DNA oxidative demethylase
MMDTPLFGKETAPAYERQILGAGTAVLNGFALDVAEGLLAQLAHIAEQSPFRHMVTPGGFRMSVAMTNCGTLGWVTDRSGYRYTHIDPETDHPWPDMPAVFRELAVRSAAEAGFADFHPDSCLINRYEPGAKMSLHQDRNERALAHPIVSVSLGLPATFLFGGLQRTDKTQRVRIEHGDVIVWGGPARLFFHGIAPLRGGNHELAGGFRYNLTFRNAG